MTKESQIKEYKERIYKAKMEIDFCNDEINKLNGLTEICPHCDGEGKSMTIHRFMPPHKFMICRLCNGIGKITKEDLIKYDEREL